MKRVLITGANSYIGTNFAERAAKFYFSEISVETLDMKDENWRGKDFSGFDIVFHVAGIAHADSGRETEEEKARYFAVNRDLAIETASFTEFPTKGLTHRAPACFMLRSEQMAGR